MSDGDAEPVLVSRPRRHPIFDTAALAWIPIAVLLAIMAFFLGLYLWNAEMARHREEALRRVGVSSKMCNAAAIALGHRTRGGSPSATDPVQVYLLSYLTRCRLP